MSNETDKPLPKFLTRPQAAEFLTRIGAPMAKTTLGKLACIGGGPTFHKFGHRTLYKPSDLTLWAETKMSKPLRSTSDVSPAPEMEIPKIATMSLEAWIDNDWCHPHECGPDEHVFDEQSIRMFMTGKEVVPEYPTPAMLDAGLAAREADDSIYGIYRAMLDANTEAKS